MQFRVGPVAYRRWSKDGATSAVVVSVVAVIDNVNGTLSRDFLEAQELVAPKTIRGGGVSTWCDGEGTGLITFAAERNSFCEMSNVWVDQALDLTTSLRQPCGLGRRSVDPSITRLLLQPHWTSLWRLAKVQQPPSCRRRGPTKLSTTQRAPSRPPDPR